MCAAQESYFISNVCFYREGEFVIDKAKVQLSGFSLPVELPIILRESILCSLLAVLYGVRNKFLVFKLFHCVSQVKDKTLLRCLRP